MIHFEVKFKATTLIAFVLFEFFFTKRPLSMAARLYYTAALVSVSLSVTYDDCCRRLRYHSTLDVGHLVIDPVLSLDPVRNNFRSDMPTALSFDLV